MARRGRGSVGTRPDRPGYWCRWKDENGAARKCYGGDTVTAAEDVLKTRLAEVDKRAKEKADRAAGILPPEPAAAPETFAGFCVSTYYPMMSARMGPESVARATYSLEDAAERFGDKLLPAIRKPDVEGFLAFLERRGNGPGTLRRTLAALRPVFAAAVEKDIISANPCDRIRLRQAQPKAVPWLTPEEIAEALALLKPGPHRDVLTLIADSGLRRGEAVALAWSDWNDEAEEIRVVKSKNGSSRQVPLPPRAVEILRRLADERKAAPKDSIVAKSPRIFATVTRNSLRLAWQKARKPKPTADGKPGEPTQFATLRIHDFRHLYASALVREGVDIPTVATLLGHSSSQMVLKVYGCHRPKSARHDAVALLARARGQIAAATQPARPTRPEPATT